MMEMREEIQNSIREILFKEWDPLGVSDLAPDNEYDSYIAGVYELLLSNANEGAIADHLRQIEIARMGEVSSPENRKRVATLLNCLDLD